MTKVDVEIQGDTFAIKLDGHATGDEKVCAAISSLVYALAGYLQNAAQSGDVKIQSMELKSGEVKIRFRGGREIKAAYEMMIIGLLQLEAEYPKLVSVYLKS